MKSEAIPETTTAVAAGTSVNALPFEGMLAKLTPTLKRITRKLNGHFSFMDDEDLLQEALIHLWSHYNLGALADKTDSYILQGCYFHLKNYIRKVQDGAPMVSLNAAIDEDGGNLEEILSANDAAPYDIVEGALQIAALEASGMTAREKEVLAFCLEGMTTREIGQILAVSHVSVVKVRNRIREKYVKLIAGGYQNHVSPLVESERHTEV
jgi:RNA polymerase sigma factor (sigma-70 family)